ncbi:MAG: oligoendopeptidase F [Anaerolineaceae bacterium]|nr:oligoendopeptidase F [Anaerolineaceae bacterium]
MAIASVLARADVPQAATWNKESVFASADAWQQEFEAVSADLSKLESFPGTLSQGPARLAEYQAVSEELERRASKLGFYARMSASVDGNDMTAKQQLGQVMGLYSKLNSKIAFAEPEMLAIGEDTLQSWVSSEPKLAHLSKYISDLFRQQAHVRSAEVEEVLGMLSEPFSGTQQSASELSNVDLQFTPAEDETGESTPVNQSVRGLAVGSSDRTLRRTVWQNYMDGYLAYKNTFANTYLTSVKQAAFTTRVRKHESTLHRQLFQHNIPVEVFHNLIDTFKKNLPTWHRYWDVRRRALGYDTIHPWDIWAPLTDNSPEIKFEQAVDMISAGMTPLGEDYAAILRQGCLEDRWVDRSVNEGKRQGAFSGGTHDTFPFIMMTYSDDLGSVSTLAHELGHSMHSYFSRKTQPYAYSGYSLFVAEVASNFNQAMTRARLFEDHADDRDFQLTLIQEAMDNFHRYFFIMPTLARFEYEVHGRVEAGKPLTANTLNDLMTDLFAEGYGSTMTDDPERTGATWATFGHLFVPFYTFQYSTGISAAHALAQDILAGDGNAVENYREFLTLGSRVYPMQALQTAGIDMTTPEAVEKTFGVLSDLVDRLESLIE